MIKNGKDVPSGTVLSTRVCVIGSGPAGVTAAWELQKAKIPVILLEGSREYSSYEASWPDKYLLYKGEPAGLMKTNEPEFLVLPYVQHQNQAWERERIFGGTSTHWGGQSRPEDPIDLQERPGFPGWPVTREELDPFYERASNLCHLHGDFGQHGDNFTTEYWAQLLDAEIPAVKGFDVEMYQFIGPSYRNFATRTFDDDGEQTIGTSDAEVILNASLLEIVHEKGRVSRLRVSSMNGAIPPQPATEFFIEADVFILACGAVANAHQLLLSNAGNEHDQVGRNFLCHPLSQGQVIRTVNKNYLNADQARLMSGMTPDGVWTDENGVEVNARFIPSAETTTAKDIGRCWFWYNYGQYYFEMAPNPDSRITLANTVDKVFKQRQVKIDWQLTSLDEKTYTTTTGLFIDAVSQLGGEVTAPKWASVKGQLVVNGHHIGTTRMSSDARKGVVDPDLKVHSLENLYVAGASVFPSAGISNPTFTLIMLSIRLADHLKRKLA